MKERTMLSRRTMLFAVPLIAACETQPVRPNRGGAALPPPAPGASEPAPMPSQAADDFVAARQRGLAPAPVGPDAMPGFGPAQRVGTDMTTAPMPSDPIRLPR
jgi:hypothetical protein